MEREWSRSLVALHYFGYFRRGPGDPPDRSLEGLQFWMKALETSRDPGNISAAFKESSEYGELKRGTKSDGR